MRLSRSTREIASARRQLAIEGTASPRSLAQAVYKTIVQLEACVACAEAGCPDPESAGVAQVASWLDVPAGKRCGGCGKVNPFQLKICRCSQIGFCDKNCQKMAWSAHRLGCKKKPPPSPAQVDASCLADKLLILGEHGAAHAGLALHILDSLMGKFMDDDEEDERMRVTYKTDAATEAEVLSAQPVVDATLAAFPQHNGIAKIATSLRRLLRTKLWHCQGGEASGKPNPSKEDSEGLEELFPMMEVPELKRAIAMTGLNVDGCKSKVRSIMLRR